MMLRSLPAALLLVAFACPATGKLQDDTSVSLDPVAITVGGFEVAARKIEITSAETGDAMIPFACSLHGNAAIKSHGFAASANNIEIGTIDGRGQILLGGDAKLKEQDEQLQADAHQIIVLPGDRLIVEAKEGQKARLMIGSSEAPTVIEGEMIEYVFSTGTVVTTGATKFKLGTTNTAPELYGTPQPAYSQPPHNLNHAAYQALAEEKPLQSPPQNASRSQPPANNIDQ